MGSLRLTQIKLLHRQVTHIRLREAWPVKQLLVQIANEHGGYFDPTDKDKIKAYEKQLEKEKRGSKLKEPRRLKFKETDFVEDFEAYPPFLDRFETRRARKSNDPLEDIPVVILREIRAELDAKRLPNWWYATFPLKELDETLGRVKAEE